MHPEPILANARQFDNEGNRRRKIREVLFRELGIGRQDELLVEHTFVWRGTRRRIDVLFESLFDITEDRLVGREGTWSVVIGLPFDSRNRTAADGRARLDGLDRRAETLVWQPSMLSERALRDLGTLVVIDNLMVGERFEEAARHLSVADREQARALLRNRQSQLEQRLRTCLEVAYGIRSEPREAVDAPLDPEGHLISLDGTFPPRMPVGANLAEAFEALLDQLYSHRFPAHPHFDQEIKMQALRRVLESVRGAIQSTDQRLLVADRGARQLLHAIANPLKLASMGQTHLVAEYHWPTHFTRLGQQDDGPLTVRKLRAWTDEPRPMGLTRDVQNLIILCFAEQSDRSFFKEGVAVRPTLERLDDDLELREQALPSREDWDRARHHAQALFGVTPPEVLNAGNVDRLVEAVRTKVEAADAPLGRLVQHIEERLRALGVEPDTADRVITLRSARALLAAVQAAGGSSEAIQALARAELRTSQGAMTATLARADRLDQLLQQFDWALIESVVGLKDHRQEAAEAIQRKVAEALAADEQVQPLDQALNAQRAKALGLLADTGRPGRRPGVDGPEPPTPSGREVVDEGQFSDLSRDDALRKVDGLRERLAADPEAHLSLSWRLTRERPS